MTQEIYNVETIIEDGYILSPEGEILGHVKFDGTFHVTSRDTAEWVLEKMADADAEMAAISARLATYQANLQAQHKAQQTRREWLEVRYGEEIEAWAKANLPAGKKTVQLDHGKCSFRKVNGGLRVLDADAALAFAEANEWEDAIKTVRTFQISKLEEGQRARIETAINGYGEGLNAYPNGFQDLDLQCPESVCEAFEIKPDSETFKIDTGAV